MELIHLVKRHQYNFLNSEVLAASMEMDHWLNLYQQNSLKKQGEQKNEPD
jgi:hypothetical protein